MEQIPVSPLSRKLVGVVVTLTHLNTAPPRVEEKRTPGQNNFSGYHSFENPNGSDSVRKHQLMLSQYNSRRRSAFVSSVIPEEEENCEVFQAGNQAEVVMDNLKDQIRANSKLAEENKSLQSTISEIQQQKEKIEDQFKQDKEQYSQEMQKATQMLVQYFKFFMKISNLAVKHGLDKERIQKQQYDLIFNQDDDDLRENELLMEFTSENADMVVHTVRNLVLGYRQLALENHKLQDTSAELMRQQSEFGKISEEYRQKLEVLNQKLQQKEEEYLKLVEDIQTKQQQVVRELQQQFADSSQQLQQKEEQYKRREEEKQKLYLDQERTLLQQLENRNQEIQQLQKQEQAWQKRIHQIQVACLDGPVLEDIAENQIVINFDSRKKLQKIVENIVWELVYWREGEEEGVRKCLMGPRGQSSFTIQDLNAGTKYFVQSRAGFVDEGGVVEWWEDCENLTNFSTLPHAVIYLERNEQIMENNNDQLGNIEEKQSLEEQEVVEFQEGQLIEEEKGGFEHFEEEVIQVQETPDSNLVQPTDDYISLQESLSGDLQAEVEQFQPIPHLEQNNGIETPEQQQFVLVEVNSQPQTPQNSSTPKSSKKRKSKYDNDGGVETKRRKYNLRKYTVDVVDKQNLTPILEDQVKKSEEGVGHEMLQSRLHHSRELKRIVSSAEERQDLLQMARQELEEGEIPDIIPQLDEQQRTPTVATTQSGGRKGRGRPSGSRRSVKSDGAVNQDVSSRPRRSNTRSQKSKK